VKELNDIKVSSPTHWIDMPNTAGFDMTGAINDLNEAVRELQGFIETILEEEIPAGYHLVDDPDYGERLVKNTETRYTVPDLKQSLLRWWGQNSYNYQTRNLDESEASYFLDWLEKEGK